MSDQQTEQELGKYTILRELGRGGFATVYLAQDNVLRRSIALKILHPLLLADPDFVRRFEKEAHATAQLDHPHIATIYELGQLEGRLYIAIQLLAGGTLADRIRQRGPLPFAEAVAHGGQLHERGGARDRLAMRGGASQPFHVELDLFRAGGGKHRPGFQKP